MNKEKAKSTSVTGDKKSSDSGVPETFAILSHELLTPLTLIKGYTSTLLQFGKEITEDEKEEYLRSIDSAANRIIHLLENLRDITRLEKANIITISPVSFSESLQQVLSDIQKQTTKHVINFHPHTPLPLIKADEKKLEHVIYNIVENAIKYSPEGGNIDVGLQVVRTAEELERLFPDSPMINLPSLVVSVADTGVGIPKDELGQIFVKFYRAKTALTRSIPGVGLGLYICKLIIEAHGGKLWARNRPQGGSIFFFSLPNILD